MIYERKLQRKYNGFDKQIHRAIAKNLSSNSLDYWFREMLIFSNHQKNGKYTIFLWPNSSGYNNFLPDLAFRFNKRLNTFVWN